MRQLIRWSFPVVAIVVAATGCSSLNHQGGLLGAFSGRDANPAAASPASLAGDQAGEARSAAGGPRATLVSAPRSAPAGKWFQLPKCTTSS